MIGYIIFFDSNKVTDKKITGYWSLCFKVTDKKLLKSTKIIRERVSSLIYKEIDSEPVYGNNDEYINTKIKIYGDKVKFNFQGKKMPKENTSCKCFSLIMLDSVIKANKKYYPQTLLEECKYEVKGNKNKSNDDLDPSPSDESENEFDNDFNDECKKSDNESNN